MCRCVLGATCAQPRLAGQRMSMAAAATVTVTQTTSRELQKAQRLKEVSMLHRLAGPGAPQVLPRLHAFTCLGTHPSMEWSADR